MDSPIELRMAILLLVAEYLIVGTTYIVDLLGFSSADHVLSQKLITMHIAFLVGRPVVIFLLWRGFGWVRTLILWIVPIYLVLMMFLVPNLLNVLVLAATHSGTIAFALISSMLAVAALYSSRVGLWFRDQSFERKRRSRT
jgi:hypothetical protein